MKKASKQKTCRRRYTEAERLEILEEFNTSGHSQVRFAAQRGISTTTLRNWLRESQELVKKKSSKKFLPVRIMPETREDGGSCPGRSFEITLKSRRRLYVPSGFDPEEVRLLVGILEETC
jgi:transposase-like protein